MFYRRDIQADFASEPSRHILLNRHSAQVHPYRRRPTSYASSGLSANAAVRTARGEVCARDLRVGDLIYTLDHGLRPLRWVGVSRPSEGEAPLVRVTREGARSQTVLAPQHLVHLSSPKADLVFGASEVLCPAKTLLGTGAFVADSAARPSFVHLLFDSFELIQVGEIWVESFVPDMPRIRLVDPQVAREIIDHLPRLAHDATMANYVQDRLVLDAREVRCLFSG